LDFEDIAVLVTAIDHYWSIMGRQFL